MAAAIDHRGPDGRDRWQDCPPAGPAVQLLHSRLAIQDLSKAAAQPMHSACGRYVLVFNGEIYNQNELRALLQAQGVRLHSSGDTEVLLQLLLAYGLAALQRLRGMYAFCLWDRQERQALLARDPFGIKPLYLWQGQGGRLLFASETRALLASGLIPGHLHLPALAAFLETGSLPEPLTLVQGITSLPPGTLATWKEGRLRQQAHWQPSYALGLSVSRVEAVATTREALQESVRAHRLSDVSVGLFLSGGLDAAGILALAEPGLATLTVGFREENLNEAPRAAMLAAHFGARHSSLLLEPLRAADLLPRFLSAIDQPSVDGFNTYCASYLARQRGLRVVLSGLGGDELFGGYPSFQSIPRLLRWHQRLGPLRLAVSARLAGRRSHQRQRLATFLRGPASVDAAQRCQRGLFAPVEVAALLRHWGLASQPPRDPRPDLLADPELSFPSQADRIAWLETSHYMQPQLLRDSDVFTMAHGLELRLPFVDASLSRTLNELPAAQRLAPGKHLLRQALPELQKVLPPSPKQGFTLPFQVWFDQPDCPVRPGSASLPLPPAPADLDLTPWARRWGLMVLRHWLEQNLEAPWN
jgi:asparagine synthase (glutamine-hydrolysing)